MVGLERDARRLRYAQHRLLLEALLVLRGDRSKLRVERNFTSVHAFEDEAVFSLDDVPLVLPLALCPPNSEPLREARRYDLGKEPIPLGIRHRSSVMDGPSEIQPIHEERSFEGRRRRSLASVDLDRGRGAASEKGESEA